VTKLLSLAAAIGVSFFCIAATSAMPLAPLEQLQTNLTIPVAGGCAPGFHRGPYGGCRRNAYYGGAVVAPGVAACAQAHPTVDWPKTTSVKYAGTPSGVSQRSSKTAICSSAGPSA
jgi:hypothetical protein